MHACFRVRTLAPTLVPNVFATSLAPMLNAKIKATIKPNMRIQNSGLDQSTILTNYKAPYDKD